MRDLIEHLKSIESNCAGCDVEGQSVYSPLCDACLMLHLTVSDPSSKIAQEYSANRAFFRAEKYARESARSARIGVEVLVTPPLIITSDKIHPNEASEYYAELMQSEAV